MQQDNFTLINKTICAPVFERRHKGDRRIAKAVDTGSAAYKAGYSAGMADAKALQEGGQVDQNAISKKIDCVLREFDSQCRDECASLIQRLCETAAPTLIQASLHTEINEVVEAYVVRRREAIVVQGTPEIIEHISKGITDSELISFEADQTLNPGAIKVRWRDGGMFHDPGAFISEFTNMLAEQNTQGEE